ncbi:glycoside hydrolase family 43 protein [Nocardioides caricicola]|uniref:Glycoside hydrolase family 43 protein n=1 Tax=Nocardioides caricicola TaxID=634770 RepID=A0ABW0MWQ1_9ACTN
MALVAALMMALVVELGGVPASAQQAESVAKAAPVFRAGGFADPSVVRYDGGYLAISTSPHVQRAIARTPQGPWHRIRPALPRLPHWAARNQAIWAADLVQTRAGGWRLYYSAAVGRGDRRCIGVAVARTALDQFRPLGSRPLICPPRGAIDPSAFTGRNGRPYLLFKTQGLPSTIQLLPLTRDGRHRARHAKPRMLLRSRHVVENPVLLQRGKHLVLFTSEGHFGDCQYRTVWRRSRTLHHLRVTRPHSLLRRANTGICGPGGADVVRGSERRPLLFFHGWAGGRRVMYAMHLHWRHGAPRVRGFLTRH